jgi:uncharacterized membrane protein
MRFSLVLLFTACTSSSSGATCPISNVPTYSGFGRAFFAKYCTSCHSRSASDRHGAPRGIDFDSEADIRMRAAAIDAEAAAGPDAANTDMPDPDGPVRVEPTLQERRTLGEFLACER